MSYTLEFSDTAVAGWDRIDEALRPTVEVHLRLLAKNPVQLSHPAISPPYPAGRQAYEFNVDDESDSDLVHHFVVLFRYMPDETTLGVFAIGHTHLRIR